MCRLNCARRFSIQGFLETLLDGAVDDPDSQPGAFLEKGAQTCDAPQLTSERSYRNLPHESGEMEMSFRYFGVQAFL